MSIPAGATSLRIYSALFPDFHPLDKFYPELPKQVVEPDDPLEAPGILVIWGGSDIHPSFYNRENRGSHVGISPSPRDMAEAKLFSKAHKAGVFTLGVCRGAQLACALSGGLLVQHVSGHESGHRITTKSGESFISSSLHHQMMYPWDIPHELLAWSSMPRSEEYKGLSDEEWEKWPRRVYDELKGEADIIEPEIVWFPQTKCLAVQGHPEFMDESCAFNTNLKALLDRYCFT